MQDSLVTLSSPLFLQDQYMFIHDAILEFLTCGDTQISSKNLHEVIDRLRKEDPTHQCTGYQHQFNVLDQVSPSPTEINCSTALQHPDKNRGDKYLPGKKNCMHVTSNLCEKIILFSGNIKGCTEGRATRLHSCCDSKCEYLIAGICL